MLAVATVSVAGGVTAVVLRNRPMTPTANAHRADASAMAAEDPMAAGQPPASSPAVTEPAAEPSGRCRYTTADPGAASERKTGRPSAEPSEPATVTASLRLSEGELTVRLNAAAAPCSVHAFVTMANADFYSDTPCHRLTTSGAGMWLLQCGDPSGTGNGTPGYAYADENLPGRGQPPTYPRGTVALANAGPGTNGSQFFIVYRDSDLPPTYPILGQVTEGMAVLDRIAAAGSSGSDGDGPPKLKVGIQEIAIG